MYLHDYLIYYSEVETNNVIRSSYVKQRINFMFASGLETALTWHSENFCRVEECSLDGNMNTDNLLQCYNRIIFTLMINFANFM